MNIFRDYLEATVSYNVVELLETYDDLFDRLGIDISSEYLSDDAFLLQEQLKTILVKTAQDEGIIPEDWDIEECFNLNRKFAIYSDIAPKEDLQKVIKDFEDWCGIQLIIDD